MSHLFGIIAPVFALIGMGAMANSRRLITPAAFLGLNDIVFYAALPALLFVSVTDAPALRLADVAGTYLGACLLLFAAMVVVSLTVLRARLARAAVFGINCVFGNTVMLGIPVMSAAYGDEGLANLLAIIAFHSAVLLPIASLLIEADVGTGRGAWAVVRAVGPATLRNPVVVSIALAFAWRQTGLDLPEPLHRLLGLIAPASSPLALVCLGASLPRPRGWGGLPEMALASLAKLVLLPMLAGSVAWLAGVNGVAFKVVVITAALPTGANAFLLARRSEMMTEASAGTVLMSTALSLVTLTALLLWVA